PPAPPPPSWTSGVCRWLPYAVAHACITCTYALMRSWKLLFACTASFFASASALAVVTVCCAFNFAVSSASAATSLSFSACVTATALSFSAAVTAVAFSILVPLRLRGGGLALLLDGQRVLLGLPRVHDGLL